MTTIDQIDPWSSAQVSDYAHVFKEFGLTPFPPDLAKQIGHHFFERNIVIAHRDFEKVFARMKSQKQFINITGIASSGHYHLGHKADIDLFVFFKRHGAVNFFSVSDLDAYVSRPDAKVPSLEKAREFAVSNVADLLALGLSEDDIYLQSRQKPRYYNFAFELSKKITRNTFEAIYGHIDLGKVSANLLQYADILHPQLAEFVGKMPSITGIGLDQDPHARSVRDIAKRLPYPMEIPSFVYFEHQSGLQEGTKMSSSEPHTAIFLNDSLKEVEKKIQKAFTGGRPSVEEHRRLGGIPEICKVCELLKFHQPNKKKYEKTVEEFRSGRMLSGELKQVAVEHFKDFLESHQAKRADNMKKAEKIVFGK